MKKLLFFLQLVFFTASLVGGKVVYISPGAFGNIFGHYSDNQYKHLHDLVRSLIRLGYEVKQVGNLKGLKDVAALVCFDVPNNQIENLMEYPKEKRILFLWEPPTAKPHNYEKRYHEYFSKVYTLLDDFVDNKKYFKFYEPQPSFKMIGEAVPFSQKKLCALLTKKLHRGHPLSTTSERKKIVNFFNELDTDDFDLYGYHWSKKNSKHYKGTVKSRSECFKHYKFIFCYENAKNIKGYITAHKIFLPFIARSVPIRWSGANSDGLIPENCFISREDFDSYDDLYQYIKHMPEEEYNQYLANIERYVNSDQALLFSPEYFIHIFLDAICPGYDVDVAFTKEQKQILNRVFAYQKTQKEGADKIKRATYSYFSQHGQDKYIFNTFFEKKRDGVFVDIGAYDGVKISNSLFFEKYLGWNGVCVEPMPAIFNELKKNRTCFCVHGCIADFDGPGKFLQVSGYAAMLSGLVNYYHPRHLNRIDNEIRRHGGSKEVIDVQCYTLKNILNKYGIDHIDYLSIDTEGNELAVLKTIDFNDIAVDIISVENNYHCPEIKQLLESNGFCLVKRLSCDEIYKKIR